MKKNLQTMFSTRQYMLSRKFELYYYSEQGARQLKRHSHDYYEFYFFLEGDVSIEIGGESYPLKEGDLIIIPPFLEHRALIQSQEIPYRRFVFWVSRDYASELMEISRDYGYLLQHAAVSKNYIFHNETTAWYTIQSKVFGIIEELHGDRFGKDARLSLGVQDLLLHLNRLVYEQNHPMVQKEEQSLYRNLLNYIEAHLEEDLSLERLAECFFVSKYHIAHVFKENLGISIHQYITRKRLNACKAAIFGNNKISEVYLRFGFRDYSSFYRAFKKEYGISPKEFQELSLSFVDE